MYFRRQNTLIKVKIDLFSQKLKNNIQNNIWFLCKTNLSKSPSIIFVPNDRGK